VVPLDGGCLREAPAHSGVRTHPRASIIRLTQDQGDGLTGVTFETAPSPQPTLVRSAHTAGADDAVVHPAWLAARRQTALEGFLVEGVEGGANAPVRFISQGLQFGSLGDLDHDLGVQGMHQGRAGLAAHDHVAGQQ
jgi:hypothetical protein